MAGNDQNSPENLDLIQEVTKAIQAQTKALDNLSAALGRQQAVSQGATKAAKEQTSAENEKKDAVGAVTEAMRSQTDGADGLAAALGRQSTATEGLTKKQIEQIDTVEKLAKNIAGMSTALGAAGEMMNGTKMLFTGGLDLIKGGFAAVQAGIGLLMSPFKALMGMAAEFANQRAEEAWAANQKLTASFGDAEGATGSFVKTMKDDLGGAASSLSKSGKSMWSAIGYGPAVLEEAIKLAEGFGNSLHSLKDQIAGATDEMFLMSRGMNMSSESLKNLAINAKASGGSFEESMQEGMVASAHLANQFGLDVKDIGKNMDKMQKNMASFGHMAPKELAAVAAYSAKLGVEIESLDKLMGTFDTFEGAAAQAGKLAEAFGMNVDVMGMMNSDNPAERMDMLRKSFEETGKSVNDLSRHEMKLLSESMGGIPVEELKAGLSMSSDELGFGDFADAAEEAAAKVSPEEAMEKVASSIEELNKALSKMAGGPLQDFIKGFKHGLMNSKEFKAILSDIGDWLAVFNKAGVRIGKLFAKIFLKDGTKFKKIIEGIFNLEKAEKFMAGVEKAFDLLFGGLSEGGDPAELAANFFDSIMAAFQEWTGGTGTSGLMDLLKDMLEGALKMLAGIAPKIMKTAAKYIQKFADALRDFLADPAGGAAGAVGDGLMGAFQQAGAAIMEAWPALKDAILSLMGVLWDNLKGPLFKIWSYYMAYVMTKALVTGMMQAAGAAIIKKIALKYLGGVGKTMEKASTKQFGDPKAQVKKGKSAGSFFTALKEVLLKIKDIGIKLIFEAGAKLIAMAVLMGVGMVAFAAAVWAVSKIVGKIPWGELAKTFVVMGVSVLAVWGLSKVAKSLDKKSMIQGGIGLLAGAVFLAISGAAFAGAIWLINKIIGKIPFMQFVKNMAMVGISIVAVFPMILAGMLLYATVNSGVIVLAGLGLLAGAVFLALLGSAYGAAVLILLKVFSGINLLRVMELYVTIGISIVATVALIASGALLALAIPGMLLAAAGIKAASKFLGFSLLNFSKAIKKGLKPFMNMDLKKVVLAMVAIGLAVVQIIEFMAIGAVFAVMGFWGGIKAMKKGVSAMVAFATDSLVKFAKVIRIIDNLPIKDPKMFKMKIDAIAKIIKAVGDIADIGLKAMAMSIVASLFSDKGPGEMMKSMSDFLTNTIDSIRNLVVMFVLLAHGMDEKALKGASAIAGIIGGIAKLAGALMGPMTEIIKNSAINALVGGEGAATQMSAVAGAIGNILVKLNEHLPTIVGSLIAATAEISNPDDFLKKSQALEAMFNGILAMIEAVTKLNAMATVSAFGVVIGTDSQIVTDMFGRVAIILGHDYMFMMMRNAKSMIDAVPAMNEDQIKTFNAGMDGVIGAIKSVSKFGEYMWSGGGVTGLDELKSALEDMDSNGTWPSMLITRIVTEAASLARIMTDMEADIGKVALKPLVDGILGYDGERTFTVAAEAVNLNVKLQIAVSAEQLATAIAKGNEDTDGFFKTTEKADKALLEGDRGIGKWFPW